MFSVSKPVPNIKGTTMHTTQPQLARKPVPPALAKGEGAEGRASPRSTGGAIAPNSSNFPLWASNVQARHLIDQLRDADLYVTGGQSVDDGGYRYRASYASVPGAKANRNLKLLRDLADVYAEAISDDLPALTAHFKTSRGFNHEADALVAVVRGDAMRVAA